MRIPFLARLPGSAGVAAAAAAVVLGSGDSPPGAASPPLISDPDTWSLPGARSAARGAIGRSEGEVIVVGALMMVVASVVLPVAGTDPTGC